MESYEISTTTERYHTLKLFLSNTRSAKGKTTELQFLTMDSDIICLTETHLDQTIPNSNILTTENRTIFRRDRNIHGGGVLIAVNDQLKPKLVDLSKYDEEIIAVKIEPKTVICCYYRPHVQICNTYVIDDILSDIEREWKGHNILMVGDMNFPGIDWINKHVKTMAPFKKVHQSFLDVLHNHRMEQLITNSTHVLGNTLDLICTNQPGYVQNTEIIAPGLSDHFIIHVYFQQEIKSILSKPRTINMYKKADQDAFSAYMQQTNDKLAKLTDPGAMWNIFTNDLTESKRQHVPTKEIKQRHPSIPEWFNKRALKLQNIQKQMYKRAKTTMAEFDKVKYKQRRREFKKELESIRKAYYTNRIYQPLKKGNSKPFFKLLGADKSKKSHQIALKDDQNMLTEDPEQCAELLNAFFHSQFQDGYLAKDFKKIDAVGESLDISTDGVEKLIRDLPNGKSPGPDGILKADLLIDLPTTAKSLAMIYKASLEAGKLPGQWKNANVTPIHKGGDPESPNNYRPISLTSIPCKMMEHIVLHYLNKTLDDVLHHRQHGFRRGLSCQTQLCATYNDLAKAADDGHTTHAIVMDFKKAFDKVPHLLLLQKLQIIPGINTQLLNWIHDFLSNRQQSVVLNGKSSQKCTVTSGVPQGSVLGQHFFYATLLTYLKVYPVMLLFMQMTHCYIRL